MQPALQLSTTAAPATVAMSRAQHCAVQCWLPVAEKGSALKSLKPSQKLQEGQQKGAMSNTELLGLKKASGQRCDHRTVLLTWTNHALPNQFIFFMLYFYLIFFNSISLLNIHYQLFSS